MSDDVLVKMEFRSGFSVKNYSKEVVFKAIKISLKNFGKIVHLN